MLLLNLILAWLYRLRPRPIEYPQAADVEPYHEQPLGHRNRTHKAGVWTCMPGT